MTDQVNEMNAYRFSDNYAILTESEPIHCFGCEHNHQEAEALARWIQNRTGRRTKVVHNTPDQVRASKEIRPADPVRYQDREQALRETGVWPTETKQRKAR